MSSNKSTNREFRKIPSLKYLYEINEDGSIIRNVKSKRCLKCFLRSHNSNTQYWCTQVNIKDRGIHKHFIHNLVAECWLGTKPPGFQTDHIDRNSLNNHYTNLRYVSKSEQMLNRDYDTITMQNAWIQNLGKKNGFKVNPVRLVKDNESIEFPTARRAAKYLASVYGKLEKSYNDKFHHRRSHIENYDVIYLNEETVHDNQETGKKQSGL